MLIPNPGSDLAFRVRKGLLGSHFNATSAETFTGLTGAPVACPILLAIAEDRLRKRLFQRLAMANSNSISFQSTSLRAQHLYPELHDIGQASDGAMR